MANEIMVVRLHLREADHGKRRTVMQEALKILHDQHRVQSVVVLRGIAGFDESGEIHAADLLRLNVDLPLVIEFWDTPAVVQSALTLLVDLIPAAHILCWRAEHPALGAGGGGAA